MEEVLSALKWASLIVGAIALMFLLSWLTPIYFDWILSLAGFWSRVMMILTVFVFVFVVILICNLIFGVD